MTSTIAVAVTADSTKLTSNLAIAQNSVRTFQTAVREAANDIASTTAPTEAMRAALDAASAQLVAAKSRASELSAELKRLNAEGGSGVRGLKEEIEKMAAPLEAVRGLVSAVSEAFLVGFGVERIVESIEKVAELGEQLNKTSKITGISVEALSGWNFAAEQMGIKAETLDNALPKLGRSIQNALAQPSGVAARAFDALGISQEELREHSNDLIFILNRMAQAFHDHADGANADAIAMAVIRGSGAELIPLLREGPEAIQKWIDRNRELGHEMTGEMAEAMEKHRQSVRDLGAVWGGLEMTIADKVIPTLNKLGHALTDAFTQQGVIKGETAILEGLRAELTALQAKAAGESGLSKWWDDRQIKNLQRQIQIVEAELASVQGKRAGATKPADRHEAEGGGAPGTAEDAHESGNSSKPEFGNIADVLSEMEKFHVAIAKVKAEMTAMGASNTEILAREAQMWKEQSTNANLSTKERAEAEKQFFAVSTQLSQAERAQTVALAHAKTEATRAGSEERVAAAKAEADAVVRVFGQGSVQAIEAQTRYTNAVRANSLERVKITIEEDNHKIAAINKALTAYVKSEDSKTAYTQEQVDKREADEIAAVTKATNERLAIIAEELAAMEKADLTQTTEYAKLQAEQTAIFADEEQRRTAIHDKAAQERRRIDDEEARAWERSFQPVSSAFDTMVRGMMSGREDFRTVMLNTASQFVQSEIASDARMLVSRLALYAAEKAGAIGEKNAEELAAKSSNSSILGIIINAFTTKKAVDAGEAASTVATEAAKTGAVEAGAAVRSATAVEEAAAGRAASAEAGSTSIMNDAYKAAAGAYASAADIPFVGWIIAPFAAAAAFAAVAAYDVLSAESGFDIPAGVNPMVQLHQREMVLPAAQADVIRGMAGFTTTDVEPRATQGSAGGDTYAITIQAIDTQTGAQFLRNNIGAIASHLKGQLRNMNTNAVTVGRP